MLKRWKSPLKKSVFFFQSEYRRNYEKQKKNVLNKS